MLALLRKNMLFIFLFVVMTFIVFFVFSFLAQPLSVEDILSPVSTLFQVLSLSSPFIAATVLLFVLGKKFDGPTDALFLVFFSTLLFCTIIIIFNAALFFSISQEEWEQAYLDDVLVSYVELSFEEFQLVTLYQAIVAGLTFVLQNLGAAFAGIIFAGIFFEKH